MRRPALLLVLAVAACDDGDKRTPPAAVAPAPAPPRAAPADAAVDAEEPPVAPPADVLHRAGPAYLGVEGVGLVKLDGGRITRAIAHAYPIQHLAADARGTVYVAAIGGLWRIAGGTVEPLPEPGSLPLEALKLGPDGVLWATDHRSVHRWDGAWTEEPPATFDGALLMDLAIDLDGRVWVVTSEALWRLDGDRWNRLATPFAGSQPFFDAIAVASDGAVYVTCLRGLFVHRDGSWRQVPARDTSTLDEVVVGPAGHVVASGGVDDLVVLAPGKPPRTSELGRGPAQARRGDVEAVDGAGRIWLATDNGLVILDDAGGLVQQWRPGTVDGVAGAITAVAVIGDGPTLPALRAAATGTITGTVVQAGQRVAGARVELCDRPLTYFQRTPCDASSLTRSATTAADGSFRLDDVPVGSYGFAVKPGKTWLVLIDRSCCTDLVDGGTYDIGAITLR